jgi:Na+/H+ antiporter NhaD/arsenite permease-like protein
LGGFKLHTCSLFLVLSLLGGFEHLLHLLIMYAFSLLIFPIFFQFFFYPNSLRVKHHRRVRSLAKSQPNLPEASKLSGIIYYFFLLIMWVGLVGLEVQTKKKYKIQKKIFTKTCVGEVDQRRAF